MPNYIEVTNLNNGTKWEKQFLSEDSSQIIDYSVGRKNIDLLSALFFPVRTNNIKNFAKDFLLPTTFNYPIKIQNIVVKVFAIFSSIFIDIITFPIRLITCIPRKISNEQQQQQHLLLNYLKQQNVDKKLIDSDYVRVKLYWETTSTSDFIQYTSEDGTVHRTARTYQNYIEKNINFIELPIDSSVYEARSYPI